MIRVEIKQGLNVLVALFPWCQRQLGSLGISATRATEGGILEAVEAVPGELLAYH